MTTTLTARGPEDLLAAVPVVLGFRPSDSVVMLTFDARRTFHARVDLPPPDDVDDDLPVLSDALRDPCLVHGVGRVAFVVYSGDAALSRQVGARLRADFAAAEIGVIDVLRAHEGHWWPVPGVPGDAPSVGRPYDDTTHPFAAQAVFDGQVTHASRDDLRKSLAPEADARERVRARQRGLPAPGSAEVGWVCEALGHWAESGLDPDDDEAARVLHAVTRVDVRDAALFAMSRETSPQHLRIWSGLLRRAPAAQVPAAAVLTAFAAWQSGHGALAWCALDRCFEVEPDQTLARGLAECLTRAVPPSAWDDAGAGSTDGSPGGVPGSTSGLSTPESDTA
jgi:hypothetical protein